MKDSSVSPAGLFDPHRQKRLLEGLAHRFQSCLDQRQAIRGKHAIEHREEESRLSDQRRQQTDQCRLQRRQMLERWDDAEEELTSSYEQTAVNNQKELHRLSALYRRKAAEQKKAIERKVEARRQAVLQQYENRKNQPGVINRKQIKQIDASLADIRKHLEWSNALTIRRLDRLPDVPPSQDPDEVVVARTPESIEETVETIEQLTRTCRNVVDEMQTGTAYKVVDSFYLPAAVAALIASWALGSYFLGPHPPWIPMMIGSLVIGVVGFIVYAILLWPLKKMTRHLYPKVVRTARAAEEVAGSGRDLSTRVAKDAAAELIQRRDAHLAATARWQEEQLRELETHLHAEQEAHRKKLIDGLNSANQSFTERFSSVEDDMRHKAESVAQTITETLAQIDQSLQQQRDQGTARRQQQLERLAIRLKQGASRGIARIITSDHKVRTRFPDWDDVLAGQIPQPQNVDFLPLGWLCVDESLQNILHQGTESVAKEPDNNGQPNSDLSELLSDTEIPELLPVVLHRRLHSGVIIHASHSQLDRAVEMAHQILWRLISGAAPSRAKLTLIDPLGRGQHFTSFMALADYDPSMVGHRVWTTDSKIDARLGELAHHVEDVLQASLRDRFERSEDYNQVAGSMAEPYRMVAAVGLPEGLTRDAYKHLRALIESGLRCGIFTILVCDDSKPWPSDMPVPGGKKVLHLSIDRDGQWQLDSDGLEGLPFRPAATPPISMRQQLVENIGAATVAASRVEIPLEAILSNEQQATGSTDDGIEIAIGSQGANRTLSLDLGEGVRQHVLIAGKTGSGKSTLLHSIITSGAYRYSPDQLHFYLLDFKKGVEFKPYAESGLPHARVIGIESEREFGRSVLQRLDEELQRRGELFRAESVQELHDYRQKSGKDMPRILLVIDEFQELFVRDDRLAGDCAMLLDRLVRQGRSFGMHVVLSSQSLAGAYSLPRATLGQMAVRIAMQCSESDAALILSDDNTAARLISRPGEAIYNDAGGLLEGNQPFQVAWLSSTQHQEMLAAITSRDRSQGSQLPPPVIFEGNRPCRWQPSLADAAIASASGSGITGLLGESVEIGPPRTLQLTRNTGRNVLMIAPGESRGAVLAASVSAFAKSDPNLKVIYLDGNRVDDAPTLTPWFAESGIACEIVRPRDSEATIVRLSETVKERGDEAENVDPLVVIIDPLERFRDFRQDESFNFSLDAAGSGQSGASALQDLLRDGPSANVFVMLVCGSAETLSRWLPRASQHDLELRILGRMNATDSSALIDTPMAADLSAATMLLYDDSDGRITKFRQCDLPRADAVKAWLGS
jgi:S-DNA-T family DNA segregation ATPase FtsK/SpoIIIE